MKHSLLTALAIFCLVATGGAEPLGPQWRVVREGDWHVTDGVPPMLRQGKAEGATSAVNLALKGEGRAWRCFVEPALEMNQAGIWFGAAPELSRGFLLTLGGSDAGGVVLRDAANNLLWEDRYAPWAYYTPYLVEGVVEPGRVRVQMFGWDRETLLAQSDWIEVADAQPTAKDVLALHTDSSQARFYGWERAETPLSPIVPNSPTKMRLANDDTGTWVIVGDGDWRWTSADKNAIRQGAPVERSTALNTTLGGSEGTWQCRVQVDKGAGGSGMVMLAGRELERGFLLWLGGTYGDGCLMLYRLPLNGVWSGPQGKWHYDTEYVLEGTIKKGKVSARMLEADGETVIAASPKFALTDEEKAQTGFVGFQTWKGTAQFHDFSEQTRAKVARIVAAGQASPLGEGWRMFDGMWRWVDDTKNALEQTAESGTGTLLCLGARGARAVFRCRVAPGEKTQAVALLFQVSPDLSEGFECRLEKGAVLRTLEDRTLWQKDDFAWQPGAAYVLEGIVVNDRVRVRVLDAEGTELLRSEECYVTQANNDREGLLGFRTDGGPAQFSDWSVNPSE